MPLPDNPRSRKLLPLATGVLDYFPDAIAAIAEVSRVGGDQHHPGEPLHWDRSKSTDEADALIRHFLERGTIDNDGLRHTAKMAWRALALLQKELEQARDAALHPISVQSADDFKKSFEHSLVAIEDYCDARPLGVGLDVLKGD